MISENCAALKRILKDSTYSSPPYLSHSLWTPPGHLAGDSEVSAAAPTHQKPLLPSGWDSSLQPPPNSFCLSFYESSFIYLFMCVRHKWYMIILLRSPNTKHLCLPLVSHKKRLKSRCCLEDYLETVSLFVLSLLSSAACCQLTGSANCKGASVEGGKEKSREQNNIHG